VDGAERLIGSWRLVSWAARADGSDTSYPFGRHPDGSLIYTPGGWMSVQLSAEHRPAVAARELAEASAGDRARAASTYFAYCGTYNVIRDVVIHEVVLCLHPAWIGTEQRRKFYFANGDLVLREGPVEVAHESVVYELHWRCAQSKDDVGRFS